MPGTIKKCRDSQIRDISQSSNVKLTGVNKTNADGNFNAAGATEPKEIW